MWGRPQYDEQFLRYFHSFHSIAGLINFLDFQTSFTNWKPWNLENLIKTSKKKHAHPILNDYWAEKVVGRSKTIELRRIFYSLREISRRQVVAHGVYFFTQGNTQRSTWNTMGKIPSWIIKPKILAFLTKVRIVKSILSKEAFRPKHLGFKKLRKAANLKR